MKNTILISLTCFVAGFIIGLKACQKAPQTVRVYSEKIKEYKDTIKQIKVEYKAKYYAVQTSTRPDTFIRNLTDTVFGNKDSFIYVTVLKGKECCEILPWKDSIINEDSLHMVISEAKLADCDKQVKKSKAQIKVLKWVFGIIDAVLIYIAVK